MADGSIADTSSKFSKESSSSSSLSSSSPNDSSSDAESNLSSSSSNNLSSNDKRNQDEKSDNNASAEDCETKYLDGLEIILRDAMNKTLIISHLRKMLPKSYNKDNF
jgi:hypothetical protein